MSKLFEIEMLGGVFSVEERDISYHNPEYGPNREDEFSMFFDYHGTRYVLGSSPTLEGAKKYAHIREKNPAKFFDYLALLSRNAGGTA